MSFSISIPTGPATEFDAAADKAVEVYEATAPITQETRESLDQVVAVAKQLVASGIVGQNLAASISGHANPEHKPQKGWSNDCVSISIYSTDVLPAEPSE